MRLGKVLADYRYANRISGRDLAKELGIKPSTLHRMEKGENSEAKTLTKILEWLFADGDVLRREKPEAE